MADRDRHTSHFSLDLDFLLETFCLPQAVGSPQGPTGELESEKVI